MKKGLLSIIMLMMIVSCSNTGGNRKVASSWATRATDGAETGVYVTKDIRDYSGTIGVFNELALNREYSGDNLKGLWLEALPNGGMERRAQIDVLVNGQTIDSHNILLRKGRQHFWTDINREIRDEIRQLQVRYNPSDISIQSITALVNETRRDDDNTSGNNVYSQIYQRIDRRAGGLEYTLIVPRNVEARFINFEAQNFQVKIHEITVDGLRIEAPLRPLSPNRPMEIRLPQSRDRVLDIRFRAEGYAGNSAALKVTVSSRPLLVPDTTPRPGPGPRPFPDRPPHGRSLNKVKVFEDDTCKKFITDITHDETCDRLTNFYGSKSVWSVQVNDKCINTPDTNFSQSCQAVRELINEPVPPSDPLVRFYSDDSCKQPILDLDERTNCEAWKTVVGHRSVWSVSVNGNCLNTPDVAFSANVCEKYIRGALSIQRPVANDSVELFTDDRCTKKITNVQRGDRCHDMNELFGNLNVWSINFKGRCENTPDVSFLMGCEKYSR